MYGVMKRVELVNRRAAKLRLKKEKQTAAKLFFLYMALFFAIASSVVSLSTTPGGMVMGMYGTTMMLERAGGYVLVAVVAFALAVVLTVFYMRYKNNKTGQQ